MITQQVLLPAATETEELIVVSGKILARHTCTTFGSCRENWYEPSPVYLGHAYRRRVGGNLLSLEPITPEELELLKFLIGPPDAC